MIRVLLVTDMALLRTALEVALAERDDLTIVRACGSADVSALLGPTDEVDVVTVDLDIRRPVTLDAVTAAMRRYPAARILALTTLAAPAVLRRAMRADVHGYLSRDCDVVQLENAIRRVFAGERFIDPGIAIAARDTARNPLTARERDILRLAADGLAANEIANALFLAPGTVRNYLSVITRKLGARGRLDAIRTALDANWL